MTVKFPTKKEFIKWWDNREDDSSGARAANCPIAKYLRAHGLKKANVGSSFYYHITNSSKDLIYSGKLPEWARKFIELSDKALKPYRGLPPGFK
jgi:hypothetical protein